MALFFVSFRRNFVCDFLKLPRFPLSAKERNRMLAPVKPLPVIKGLLSESSPLLFPLPPLPQPIMRCLFLQMAALVAEKISNVKILQSKDLWGKPTTLSPELRL
jgi:hypothetical protein